VRLARAAAVLAAACLALSGCSNGPRLGEADAPLVVTQLAELPPPDGFDVAADAYTYRVAPLDKLSLIVTGVPELTGLFHTDSSGRFVLPYIGEVAARGLTTAELSSRIEDDLRSGNYVNDPHVAVNIEEAGSLAFTVDGQVNDPGDFTATPGLTLMRAVAQAKGVNEFARLNDVVVFRTVKGQSLAALYDLDAIRDGTYADPRIYPADVVVVGDTAATRRLLRFVQALPLVTTPLVLALQTF